MSQVPSEILVSIRNRLSDPKTYGCVLYYIEPRGSEDNRTFLSRAEVEQIARSLGGSVESITPYPGLPVILVRLPNGDLPMWSSYSGPRYGIFASYPGTEAAANDWIEALEKRDHYVNPCDEDE